MTNTVYLNRHAFEVLEFMRSAPGQAQPVHMPMLSERMDVPEDRLHGRQHFVSLAIEELRRLGLIEDVPDRCWACNRPPRLRRVVVLNLTDLGRTVTVELRTSTGQRNRRARDFEELPVEEQIHQVSNEFWNNLGRLVALTLDKVPEDHHDELLCILQNKCSVYSVDYTKYLTKD